MKLVWNRPHQNIALNVVALLYRTLVFNIAA